jgi:hypothetical protein
MGLLLVSCG